MLLRPGFGHSVLQSAGLERVPQATANSFYTMRVAPLLAVHCIGCHGAERDKGGLRLDSFAGTMRGGKHGAVTVVGDARDSELLTRITEGMTEYRCDGKVGYGLSEYLDQIVDGKPVSLA